MVRIVAGLQREAGVVLVDHLNVVIGDGNAVADQHFLKIAVFHEFDNARLLADAGNLGVVVAPIFPVFCETDVVLLQRPIKLWLLRLRWRHKLWLVLLLLHRRLIVLLLRSRHRSNGVLLVLSRGTHGRVLVDGSSMRGGRNECFGQWRQR